jgi:hypothetical protein
MVGAKVAPHITASVSVTECATEAAAKSIGAKTITFANVTRSARSTRIGVFCELQRGYMALASHSGSCEHRCSDQCSRQNFEIGHSISPKMKATSRLAAMEMVKRVDR